MSAQLPPGRWALVQFRRGGPTHVVSEDGRYVADRVTPDFLPIVLCAPDLLALAHRYASECGECAGTRLMPDDEPCVECDDIWRIIDKAEGRT